MSVQLAYSWLAKEVGLGVKGWRPKKLDVEHLQLQLQLQKKLHPSGPVDTFLRLFERADEALQEILRMDVRSGLHHAT